MYRIFDLIDERSFVLTSLTIVSKSYSKIFLLDIEIETVIGNGQPKAGRFF